jgi:hypothetical protein
LAWRKKRSPRHSTRICCQATSAKITWDTCLHETAAISVLRAAGSPGKWCVGEGRNPRGASTGPVHPAVGLILAASVACSRTSRRCMSYGLDLSKKRSATNLKNISEIIWRKPAWKCNYERRLPPSCDSSKASCEPKELVSRWCFRVTLLLYCIIWL